MTINNPARESRKCRYKDSDCRARAVIIQLGVVRIRCAVALSIGAIRIEMRLDSVAVRVRSCAGQAAIAVGAAIAVDALS